MHKLFQAGEHVKFVPLLSASLLDQLRPAARGCLSHFRADAVIGGWKLAWVSILQTGQYFSPTFSGADPSGTNTSGGLPDRSANGNLPTDQRSLTRWFDTSAFARPPLGRFGNSGINVLQGPGEVVHNVSLSKRFMLTERWHLDF